MIRVDLIWSIMNVIDNKLSWFRLPLRIENSSRATSNTYCAWDVLSSYAVFYQRSPIQCKIKWELRISEEQIDVFGTIVIIARKAGCCRIENIWHLKHYTPLKVVKYLEHILGSTSIWFRKSSEVGLSFELIENCGRGWMFTTLATNLSIWPR